MRDGDSGEKSAEKLEYKGKRYYFYAGSCIERLEKAPEKYHGDGQAD
ncbi:MAG: hypothetical protein BMS9Abin23_0848 [Thermodesulfobacteriota bacterium]|nr:MAG: hypothetical protein BMS9Abin23_0848 [Thermodesulfobacteriota bacterium]